MRIVGASSSLPAVVRKSASESPDGATSEAPRSDLTAIEAPRRGDRSPQQSGHHPYAPFVTHLLATRMQAPQTRARRRAEPDEAIAIYRSMTKPVSHKRAFGRQV